MNDHQDDRDMINTGLTVRMSWIGSNQVNHYLYGRDIITMNTRAYEMNQCGEAVILEEWNGGLWLLREIYEPAR